MFHITFGTQNNASFSYWMHELKIEKIKFSSGYTFNLRILYITDILKGGIRHDKAKKDYIHDFTAGIYRNSIAEQL